MNRQSTLFQIITTLMTRMAVLFGAFLVSVVTARLLGPEGKGILTALLVIPTLVITIADLGIRQSTAFFIGKKTYPEKEIVSSLAMVWIFASVLCMSVVGLIFYLQYGDRYSVWLMLVFLLIIPVNLGIQFLRGVMQGKMRIGSLNKAEILKTVCNFGILIVLVGLWGLGVMGAALTQLLMAVFTFYYCWRAVKDVPIGLAFNRPVMSAMIGKGFSFAVALFVLQLNYRLDIIILEAYTNATAVGVYSVGTNLAEMIWQLPAAVGMILFSKGANASSEKTSVNRTLKLIRFLVPLLVLFGLLFWVFAPVIVGLLYGKAFDGSVTVIRWLLPGILSFVIVKLLHSEMSGRGYPLFSLNVSIASLVANIGLNFLLIPTYGATGAAISSAISYTLAGAVFVLLYVRREKVSVAELLLLNRSDWSELVQKAAFIRGKLRRQTVG
ncbi:flippase [Paenibacillus sp. MAHUQ-46]|uniref:Flippase n=2 Tax=Paenibacillus TaxID=44249 RepID=A0A934IZ94_9BACL|nr:flippase [Paenibacillus roseus]MBJ6359790.1 flippase [Paenibacillus roseus]